MRYYHRRPGRVPPSGGLQRVSSPSKSAACPIRRGRRVMVRMSSVASCGASAASTICFREPQRRRRPAGADKTDDSRGLTPEKEAYEPRDAGTLRRHHAGCSYEVVVPLVRIFHNVEKQSKRHSQHWPGHVNLPGCACMDERRQGSFLARDQRGAPRMAPNSFRCAFARQIYPCALPPASSLRCRQQLPHAPSPPPVASQSFAQRRHGDAPDRSSLLVKLDAQDCTRSGASEFPRRTQTSRRTEGDASGAPLQAWSSSSPRSALRLGEWPRIESIPAAHARAVQ